MAKRAGSEDADEKIVTRKDAPQTGHNLTPEAFLSAVRDITALSATVKAANDQLKAARKRHKANGVELKVMDEAIRMAEWSRGEIRDHLATRARYFELMGLPVGQTMDMFKMTPDSVVQEIEAEAMGRTAGILGKPARLPEGFSGGIAQAWLKGHASADDALFEESEGGGAPDIEDDPRPQFLKEKTDGKEADPMLDPVDGTEGEDEDEDGPKDLEDQLDDALAAADDGKVTPLAKARADKKSGKGFH